MESFHNDYTDRFVEAILSLNTKEDTYNFLEDICTIREILDMSKRLEAAKLLAKGASYQEIISKIGISSATLSRVNKSLNYGAGGYKKIIQTLEKRQG